MTIARNTVTLVDLSGEMFSRKLRNEQQALRNDEFTKRSRWTLALVHWCVTVSSGKPRQLSSICDVTANGTLCLIDLTHGKAILTLAFCGTTNKEGVKARKFRYICSQVKRPQCPPSCLTFESRKRRNTRCGMVKGKHY